MRAAYKQVFLGQAVKLHKRAGGWHCKSQRRKEKWSRYLSNVCLERRHSEQLFESKVAEVVPGWPDDHGRSSTMGTPGGRRNGRQADLGAWNRPWNWAEGHTGDLHFRCPGTFWRRKVSSPQSHCLCSGQMQGVWTLNSVQHEAVFCGAWWSTAEKMLTADRWVQRSSLLWVSVVVGSHHSVCHTVLVPRVAQPMICWTCSVPLERSCEWRHTFQVPVLHRCKSLRTVLLGCLWLNNWIPQSQPVLHPYRMKTAYQWA